MRQTSQRLVALAGMALALSVAPSMATTPVSRSAAGITAAPAQEELDAFMEEVLERREINWDQLYNYVFAEMEKLRIKGTEIAALQSFDQEYTWYVREGYLVRSPWKINGVEVDDATRESEELEWISSVENGDEEARIERDSFFNFEFEPGNYLFAGREEFEGHEVVKIEYYPTNLFSDDDEDEDRRRQDGEDDEDRARRGDEDDENRDRGDDEDEDFDEEAFEHMFDKTSLVTMLVLPEERQIVKWTFENVGFEFLPFRWLVRMDELHASMTMHQPIEGVWLPREISAAAAASTASFNLAVEYSRVFSDYKETAVGGGVVFGRPKR